MAERPRLSLRGVGPRQAWVWQFIVFGFAGHFVPTKSMSADMPACPAPSVIMLSYSKMSRDDRRANAEELSRVEVLDL